jgi:hypothetical protein
MLEDDTRNARSIRVLRNKHKLAALSEVDESRTQVSGRPRPHTGVKQQTKLLDGDNRRRARTPVAPSACALRRATCDYFTAAPRKQC